MYPIVIFAFAFLIFIQIIFMAQRYKKVRHGFALVVRSQDTGDKVIRKGGVLVWPLVQSYIYIPMELFEIRTDSGKLKACIEDSDESILKAITRFNDFSIDKIASQSSKAVKGIKDKNEQISVLSEYGIKIM